MTPLARYICAFRPPGFSTIKRSFFRMGALKITLFRNTRLYVPVSRLTTACEASHAVLTTRTLVAYLDVSAS